MEHDELDVVLGNRAEPGDERVDTLGWRGALGPQHATRDPQLAAVLHVFGAVLAEPALFRDTGGQLRGPSLGERHPQLGNDLDGPDDIGDVDRVATRPAPLE